MSTKSNDSLFPEHLSAALEAISDGVIALDKEWQISYVNRGAEQLLRKQRQSLLGHSWWDVFSYLKGSPGEADLLSAKDSAVQRRVKLFHPPLYAWHEIDTLPTREGLIVVFRDVTDIARMKQKEAVKEAVREILDPAPIAITILRGKEHRFEYLNPMARQLLGGRHIEGQTIRNALPELEGQGLIETLDEVFRTGIAYKASQLPVAYDRMGDGVIVQCYFDVTYQPFFENDGSVAGILILSVEVGPPDDGGES